LPQFYISHVLRLFINIQDPSLPPKNYVRIVAFTLKLQRTFFSRITMLLRCSITIKLLPLTILMKNSSTYWTVLVARVWFPHIVAQVFNQPSSPIKFSISRPPSLLAQAKNAEPGASTRTRLQSLSKTQTSCALPNIVKSS
jgi:hypothetical protein